MAANSISVYLGALFKQVKEAHDDPEQDFNYNEICSAALERALKPSTIGMEEVTRLAAQLPNESDTVYEFEIKTYASLTEAEAFLELLANPEGGGYPVSMNVDPIGRYVFLVAWPKVIEPVHVG